MFRSDGLPWWAEDGGNTARASIAVIPSVEVKSTHSSQSANSSSSAEATGFVLAATECWLQALGEVKTQQPGKDTSTSIEMENVCRALLALTPPISSQEDAIMFVNALFDLFARVAPLHASACPSASIADAAATRVLLTITNILGSGGGKRRANEKKSEREEDNDVDDQPNKSKEETDNNNNSINNICTTEQQKKTTEESEAIEVEPKPIVSFSSFSSSPPKQQQQHNQMEDKEEEEDTHSLFTAVRLLAAASVPGAVHQQYAMCTRSASTAICLLSDEMIGLSNIMHGGGGDDKALSEEALNVFVRPRIEDRLALRSSHEQNKADAEDDNTNDAVVDASVLRHFADYFGEKAETARVMIDAWSEFIVPQTSSSLPVEAQQRQQKEHLKSLDRLTLSVHALTAAHIVLSRAVASNVSASAAEDTQSNNSASSVLRHAVAEMASAALKRIAHPLSDRMWLGRIRKALSAKLAEVGSSTPKVSVVSPLALASSLSALLVQLSKLELIFGGVDLHPSDSLYSHPAQQYLRRGNTKDLHDQKDPHPQPYTTLHPLRRFHTKAFLLQPTSPAKTFGCRMGVAERGESSSSFIRGVDLLCRGAVVPQRSILSSFLSSATSTTAANASIACVTLGEHVSSLAQAELAAVAKRRTVNLPVSSSSSSAPAASTTRGVGVASSSSSQQQQQQQFCSESATASLLWQSPVASWCSIFEAIASAATAAPKVTSPSSSSTTSTGSATISTTGTLLSSAAASPHVPKTVLAPSRAAVLHLAPGGASDRHTARQKLWYENLGAPPLNSHASTNTCGAASTSLSSSSIMAKLAAAGGITDPSTVLAVGSSGPLLFFFAMLEELIGAKKIGGAEVFFGGSSSSNVNCAPPHNSSSAVVDSLDVDLLATLKRQSVLLLAAAAMDAALLCLGRHTNVPATILAMFCALEGARELVWVPSSSRNPDGRSTTSTTFVLIQSFFGDLSTSLTDSDDLRAAHHLSPTSRPFLASAVDWAESAIMLRGEMGYLPFFLSPLVALGVAKMTTYGTLTPFVGMGTGTKASSSTSTTAAAAAAAAAPSTSTSSGGTKGVISSILPADDVAHWAPILCDLSDIHPALGATLSSVFEVASVPYFSRFVSFGAAARMQEFHSINSSFGSHAMVSASCTSPLGDSTPSVTAVEKATSEEPSTPVPAPSVSSSGPTAVLSVACTQAEDAMLFISSHIESYIRCAAEAAVFYSRAKQRAVALDSTAPSTVDAAAELFFGLLALISAPNVDLSDPEMRCFSSPNAHKLFVLRSLEAAIDAKVKSLPDSKMHSFLFWGHMAACEWRVLSLPTGSSDLTFSASSSSTAEASGSLSLRRQCSVPMPTPLVKRAMEAIPTPFATSPLAFVEIFATRTVDVVPMGEWHRAVSAINASKGRDAPAAIALSARLTWAAVQNVQEAHVSEHLKRLGLPTTTTSSASDSSKQQQDTLITIHPPHSLTSDPRGADIVADVWRTIKTFYVHRNPLVGISALDNILRTILLKASLSVHDAIGAAHLLIALVKYPHYVALKTFVEEEAAAEVKAEEEEEAAAKEKEKEDNTVERKAEQTTTCDNATPTVDDEQSTLPIGDTTVVVKEEPEGGVEVNGAALVSSNSDDNPAVIDEAKTDVKTEAAEEITPTEADNPEDKKKIIVHENATASTVEPKPVVSTSTNPPPSFTAPPPSPARAALAAASAAVKASASLTPMYVQVNRRMMVSLFLPLMGMLTYATASEAEAIATFTSIIIAKILVPWANQKSPPNPRIPNTSATAGDAAANANPLTLCPADELFPMLPLAGVDTSDESLEKVLRDLTATYEHALPKALGQSSHQVSSSSSSSTAAVAIGGQVSATPTTSGSGASEGSVSACAAVNALIIKGVCRRVLGLMRLHRKLVILAEDNAIRNAAVTTVVPSTTASSSAATSASSTATTAAKTSSSTAPSSVHSGLIPTITYAQHMAIVAAHCRQIDLPPPEGRSEPFIEIREMIPIGRVIRLRHLVAAAAPNANTNATNTNNNSATGVRSGGLATSTVSGQKATGAASTTVPATTGARGVAGSAAKPTTVTSSNINNTTRSGVTSAHQLHQRGNISSGAVGAAGASRLGAAGGNAVVNSSSGGKGTNSVGGGSAVGSVKTAKTIATGGKRERSRSRSLPMRSRSRSWSRSPSRGGRDRDPRNRRDNTTNSKAGTNNAPNSRLGGGGAAGQRFGGNRDNRSRSPPFGRDNNHGTQRGGAPSSNNNNNINTNNNNTNTSHGRVGNTNHLPAANNHRDGRDNRDRDTNVRRGGHHDSHPGGNDRDRAGGYGRNNASGTNNTSNNNNNNGNAKRGRSVDSRDRSPEIRGGVRRRY